MSREDQIQSIVLSLAKLQRPALNRGLEEFGLSHAQAGMLLLLAHQDQRSVKETADFLGISKSAVTQLADPLETKQFITRNTDPRDRRIVRLSLTDKGRQVLRKLAKRKFDGIRAAITNLSDREVGQLYDLIIKMANRKEV
jgi:DNA-binding MarR family transcriptional regulator